MKKSLLSSKLMFPLLFLLTVLYSSVSAQDLAGAMNNDAMYGNGGFIRTVNPNTENILGSPYISDDWLEAELSTNKNQKFEKLKVKYNVHSNEILLLKPDGDSVVILADIVKEFKLTNKFDQVNQFKKFDNLKTTDENLKSRFMHVVYEGDVALVKLTSAKVLEANKVQSGGYGTQRLNPKYEKTETYYFIGKDKEPTKTKLNKKQLLSMLKDKEAAVKSYLSKKKIDPSTENGWIETIEYYESL